MEKPNRRAGSWDATLPARVESGELANRRHDPTRAPAVSHILASECRIAASALEALSNAGLTLTFAAMLAATCRPRRSLSFIRELLTACPENIRAWLPAGWTLEILARGGVWIVHRIDPVRLMELRFKPLRRKPAASWLSDPEAVARWHEDLYRPLEDEK
jgi:hypothetical protein